MIQSCNIPYTTGILHESRHFNLNTIDSVDAIEEEDEDKYEGDLATVSMGLYH